MKIQNYKDKYNYYNIPINNKKTQIFKKKKQNIKKKQKNYHKKMLYQNQKIIIIINIFKKNLIEEKKHTIN